MQYWKYRAKKVFPHMDLEDIENPMQLWLEFYYQCKESVRKSDDEFFRKIIPEMIFYLSCKKSVGHAEFDYYTSVVIAFARKLLELDGIENYLMRYLPKEVFIEYQNVFEFSSAQKYKEMLIIYES